MIRSALLHDLPHGFTGTAEGDFRRDRDTHDLVARAACASLGLSGPLVTARQVHGAAVVAAEQVTPDTEADALVSTTPGLAIAVRVADCVPVLLAARGVRPAVAAVHAGWRGTAAGIARAGLEALCAASGAPPGTVRAVIGPAICPACYEVGQEVIDGLRGVLGDIPLPEASWCTPTRPGHACVDVRAVNAALLRHAGVTVDVLPGCTRCTTHEGAPAYWSHRRDPSEGARQVGIIAL
jgi:YfiH family protein